MVFTVKHASVSDHITLCAVIFTVRRISASVHITLRAVVVDYGDSHNLTLSSISRGRLASPDGTFDVVDARNSEVLASNPGGSDVCH